MGLVKFRNHPEQRVTELAKNLTIYAGGNENFRQDLIDYTWLLDKFQNDILTAEENGRRTEEERKLPPCEFRGRGRTLHVVRRTANVAISEPVGNPAANNIRPGRKKK